MYHLQGEEEAGCVRVSTAGSIELDMCRTCSKHLSDGEKPPLSYVRVDNGPRPPDLPQLTLLEERAVSPARVLRHLMICRHVAQRGPNDPALFQSKLRAHIISFNGPEPREIAALFPLKPSDLPELVNVILISAAQSEADLIRIARNTPALHVRGRVIAAYARHLAALHPDLAAQLDSEAVRLWEEADDGIPRDLLASASHVTTDEEALALAEHMRGRQEGYARAHYGSAEHAAATAQPEYSVARSSETGGGTTGGDTTRTARPQVRHRRIAYLETPPQHMHLANSRTLLLPVPLQRAIARSVLASAMQRLSTPQRTTLQADLLARRYKAAAQLLSDAAPQLALTSVPGLHDSARNVTKLQRHFRDFHAEYVQVRQTRPAQLRRAAPLPWRLAILLRLALRLASDVHAVFPISYRPCGWRRRYPH